WMGGAHVSSMQYALIVYDLQLILALMRVQGHACALAERGGVLAQRTGTCDPLLQIGDLQAVAIGIARQRDIPQRRQPLGTLRGVGAQPEGLGHHQHARALVGGRVVKRHKSPQGHVAVLVLDALRLHAPAPLLPSHPFETWLARSPFKRCARARPRPCLPPPVRTVYGMLVLVSGDVNGETIRTPDP